VSRHLSSFNDIVSRLTVQVRTFIGSSSSNSRVSPFVREPDHVARDTGGRASIYIREAKDGD
jgi:hypothetical protein